MTETNATNAIAAPRIPVHRVLPRLIRDPLAALVHFGEQANGRIVRVDLGTFRPYLVTSPKHVQHIFRDNMDNYVRDGKGLLWRPIRRLFGEGILAEGPVWAASRKTLQPLFTAKRVEALTDRLAEAIEEAVDTLVEPAHAGRVLDIGTELSRIVCHAIMRVLFANRVSVPDALRILSAQDTIATTIVARLLLPFVPNSIPLPGDRAFRAAVQTIDDILLPVVRATRSQPDEGDDIIATLSRARDSAGHPLTERQVRNDVVAMFATSTETTYGALTWLWALLDANPTVADRLYDEIDRVVGDGPVRRPHVTQLRYTKMVLDELLRLYPVAWLIPRTAVADDVIDGVRIPAGANLLISPYITQRMALFWDRPEVFDPERFTPERERQQHRYAHFPFGGGPHLCLGQHLFYLEAQLIVATILRRFRFRLHRRTNPKPQVAASLRPRERVQLTLLPRERVSSR